MHVWVRGKPGRAGLSFCENVSYTDLCRQYRETSQPFESIFSGNLWSVLLAETRIIVIIFLKDETNFPRLEDRGGLFFWCFSRCPFREPIFFSADCLVLSDVT